MKFTENGSITITVDINNKHDHVIVRIKDTGVGIDLSILPKLFSKFVARSEKGTGLGLYICKGIIEAHGGQIWAENNPELGIDGIDGHGAIFGFSLPLS
ncbi:MAG: sensor histidine kinase [Nitrososphaeraceae archaeon]